MSLNRYESALLLLLQKKANTPVSLTLKIPSTSVESNSDLKDTDGGDFVTINVLSMNRDIHTDYSDNHFKFHVKMDLKIAVSELTFNMDIDKDRKKLTSLITKQLNKDLNDLIHNIQNSNLIHSDLVIMRERFNIKNGNKSKMIGRVPFQKLM